LLALKRHSSRRVLILSEEVSEKNKEIVMHILAEHINILYLKKEFK